MAPFQLSDTLTSLIHIWKTNYTSLVSLSIHRIDSIFLLKYQRILTFSSTIIGLLVKVIPLQKLFSRMAKVLSLSNLIFLPLVKWNFKAGNVWFSSSDRDFDFRAEIKLQMIKIYLEMCNR